MFLKAAFMYNILLVALACNSTLIPELERRARNYIADGTVDPYINDFNLVDQWYDVTKYDQQYLMPDSTKMPADFTCGGYEPIYVKGTHPDVKKLTTTPVDVKACLRSTFDNCDNEYSIKIRKCHNNVQYFLVPTSQHASYCFDPPSIQNGNTKFSDPPVNVQLGNITVKPILNFDKTDHSGTTNYAPFVKFECTFHSQGNYVYAVHWYINGRLYKVLGPSKDIETLIISEKTMHEKDKIPLGFTLKCGVRVSQDKTGRATKMVSSPDYFAGIKVLNPRVNLPKKNLSTIYFQVTVPVGCRYNSKKGQSPSCVMRLGMFDPKGYTCGSANAVQVKYSEKCGLDITAAKEGDIWDYDKVYSFNVSTTYENYNDQKEFTLQLKASSDVRHKWWKNYQPDNIKVVVTNDTVYEQRLCYAHVDPHMQTADGYNYDCQEKGEYLMYRNTKYNIEVLMKTDTCNNGIAQCICSLMIRAGADVFSINSCRSPRFLGFLSCADGGILKVQRKNDRQYQVHTPIATYVDIYIHGPKSAYNRFMNVDIWMAPKDSENTEGLCGYMDGNQANDLTTRTGRKIPLETNIDNIYMRRPIDFTRSWRLKEEENLFTSITDKKLKHWSKINAMYCVCEQAIRKKRGVYSKHKALCSPTQYLDCELTNPTQTSRMCNIITRKKRSTRNVKKVANGHYKHLRESERLLKLINAPEKEDHHVQRREVAKQNVSESEARGHCGNVVNNSHVVSELSDSIPGGGVDAVLEQCIFDVMVGDDLSLADVHVDALNTVAQATLIRDPVYTANNTDKVEIFIKNSCPGNCSQNGKCSDQGDCECDDHYNGADCSIDERDPVTIDDLEGGGLCNLTDGDGCDCFVLRTAYLLPNFTCAISGVITYIDGTEENITETANAGEYENIFTGQCCAPVERNKRSTSQNIVFSTRYDIAISNDGNHFGSAEPLHVFDSECQDALPDSDNGHRIVLKGGFCFIDGVCIRENDIHTSDNCFTCVTHVSVYNWTRSCTSADKGDGNLGIILGATLGSVASVMVAVGIFSIWHFKLKPQHKKRKSVGDSQIFSNTAVENAQQS